MLNEERCNEIFEIVTRASEADEVEVLIAGGHHSLTRFANNTIHQNVADENYVVSIRAVIGKKTARATTNKLDAESLRRATKSAEAITEVQQPDPGLLPMAEPGPGRPDERTPAAGSPRPRPSRPRTAPPPSPPSWRWPSATS